MYARGIVRVRGAECFVAPTTTAICVESGKAGGTDAGRRRRSICSLHGHRDVDDTLPHRKGTTERINVSGRTRSSLLPVCYARQIA